jgi:hypothetical protein
MNKISKLKRVASFCVAVLPFVLAQEARPQTPPLPPFTVLLYYDGSPEFAAAHAEALAGFAEDPDYLPVIETSDPTQFAALLSSDATSDCLRFSHPVDVFVAITTDGVTATAWNALAGLVGFNSSYSSIYLDPNDGTITSHMVTFLSIPDADPVPPGAPPCFFPWRVDITDEILGNPTGLLATNISVGVSGESINTFAEAEVSGGGGGGGGILPDFGQWLRDFQDWVRRTIDAARQRIADALLEIADFLDGLGEDVTADVQLEAQVGGPNLGGYARITITVKNVPANKVGQLARKMANRIKPK